MGWLVMDLITIILTSSIFSVLASTLIVFLKEKYFDSKARERRTKALAINLVYTLDKFVLKCGMDLCETNQFIKSGGLDEDNNGNYIGKGHDKLPELFLNLEKMTWEDIGTSHISAINNLSLKIIISQSSIDSIWEVLDKEDVISQYRKEICSIGFETISITTKLREEYGLNKQNMGHYVEELLSEFDKFKAAGAYED